jgi:beta-glucosidase
VLFLGEEHLLSGEARSRAFLDLPGAQEALVDAVHAAGKPMVAVILAGRPLTFHTVAAQCGAVLYAWHPGTMGGPAIASLLLGRASPSGRLPVTFPRTVGQVPIYYSHLNTGRPASATELGIPMGNPEQPAGYTSKYIDVDFTPAYPFGYGLTYTKFEYAAPRVSGDQVSAEITNRGSREGTEVVQLYVRVPVASVAQPVRKLRGFERVTLKAGESRRVSFRLTAADFSYLDEHLRKTVARGPVQVWIAPNAATGVAAQTEPRTK